MHLTCPQYNITEQSMHWVRNDFLRRFGTLHFEWVSFQGLKVARKNFAVEIKKEEGNLMGGRDTNLGLNIFFFLNFRVPF